MEGYILDSLEDFSYPNAITDDYLESAINCDSNGTSVEFTTLVSWLANQLSTICNLQEHLTAISDANEIGTFLMELSEFLREYGCTRQSLTEGPVNERFSSKQQHLKLLDYLIGELAACRILQVSKPNSFQSRAETSSEQENDNDVSMHIKKMLITLKFPKPPETITPFQIFSKVEDKVKQHVMSMPPNHLGKPLLNCRLSEAQWSKLMKMNVALSQEYESRREMLLKRLDVTIQSFLWSDRAKNKQDNIASIYQPIRARMKKQSSVTIAHILAARSDLLNLIKTSNIQERDVTQCDVNKVMIGEVPDRGGRAWELEPPPPEMPGFQQRQSGPPRGGRGGYNRGDQSNRGGQGDHRGGRVHGGWSGDNQQQDQRGNWARGGGGYQNSGQSRGGYQQGGYQQGGYDYMGNQHQNYSASYGGGRRGRGGRGGY